MPLPNSTTPSTLAFPFTCKSHHYLKQIQLLCQTFGQVYVDLGTKGEDLARTLKQAQTQKGSMAHRGSLGKAKKSSAHTETRGKQARPQSQAHPELPLNS